MGTNYYAPGNADVKNLGGSTEVCTTSPSVIKATERRQWIIKKRSKQHLPYWKLADLAHEHFGTENLPKGYDRRSAWQDVKWCLEHMREEILMDTSLLVAQELIRLEEARFRMWRAAFEEDGSLKNLQAAKEWRRLGQRYAAIAGLDSPTRMQVDHTHKVEGADEQRKLEALRNLTKVLDGKVGKDELFEFKKLMPREAKVIDAHSSEAGDGNGEREGVRGGAPKENKE